MSIFDAEDEINLRLALRTMEWKRQLAAKRKKKIAPATQDTDDEPDDDEMPIPRMKTCPTCGGTGKVPRDDTEEKKENKHGNRSWLYDFLNEK
jgi:hypothetical protein